VKRLLAALIALVGLLPAIALAQSTTGMDIVDVNLLRYDDGGQTSLVVEFRNLDGTLDPAQLTVTANGEAVTNLAVEPLASSLEPVGIVLVIDVSGSMEGAPMEAAKSAAINFVNQKRPGDFIAIVTFADVVQTVSGFTNTAADLVSRIQSLEPAGETAFNDGVIQAVNLFDQVQAQTLRRNIIVLSDGTDTASVATTEDVLGAINNPSNPVRIFGVALESPEFQPDAIQQIAEAGDGLFLSTTDPAQLSGLYDQIQREINNLLVVRFNSPVTAAGPVEFSVTYGDLNSLRSESVPGFATTTTAGPAPTTTFAAARTGPRNWPLHLHPVRPRQRGRGRGLQAPARGLWQTR
jgi:Mg-chelatase subunit ChlD